MKHSLCGLVLLSLLTAMPASGLASPHVKPGSVEVGVHMDGYFFLDSEPGLKDTFAYGLTGAYNFDRMFGAMLAFDAVPREVNQVSFYELDLDLLFHPIVHDWFVPFVAVGPSLALVAPAEGDGSQNFGINGRLGVDIYPWEHVAFRVMTRYIARFGTEPDDETAHDLYAGAGLMVTFLGEEKKVEPVILDTDGDGILDPDDACPSVPGQMTAQGCPDRDSDTVADSKDRCPDDPGLPEYEGCGDKDGDRIADPDDRCPEVAGPAEHKGCPDTDSDGLADLDDRCPKIPGEKQYEGCPAPVEVVKKFTGKIEGITFAVNSDVIRESSYPVLDNAVSVLKQWPALRILIEGHTSSEGEREYNLDLSRRRAASVRRYLISKGIAETRIESIGYGPDRPVADNSTEEGREQNRRIEFKVIQ